MDLRQDVRYASIRRRRSEWSRMGYDQTFRIVRLLWCSRYTCDGIQRPALRSPHDVVARIVELAGF